MKKWLLTSGIILTLVIAVFSQDIRELHALYLYSKIYEPESIDENFRTMSQHYPAITIPKDGDSYNFIYSQKPEQLPEIFDYEGEERNISQWLERTHTTGIAILKGGELVYENYARGNSEDSHSIIMSVSKSMTSMLIGVALEQEKIESINDPIVKYVPSLKDSAYDDGVTIKHVLQMSSGVRWNEDYGRLDSDLVRSVVATLLGSLDDFAASITRENTPGTFNRYASIDTQVLGMVIRGATGQSYQQYFQQNLWSKLGAEHDAHILVDAVGEPLVYGGISITLRDMLRFGKLYLDDGVNHAGEQLVSSDWIRESTKPDGDHVQPGVNNPNSDSGFGYGYQWWIPLTPDEDYSAIGIYGQFIYINPKLDIVIAKTSTYPDYLVDGGFMNHESLIAFQAISKHLHQQQEAEMSIMLSDNPQ